MAIFIFEPSVSFNYDFALRHWKFLYQSIQDLVKQGLKVNLFYGEAIDVFRDLFETYGSLNVFSHQETGNYLTFSRDKNLKLYFQENEINWFEYQQNMVVRGLKNRKNWDIKWIKEAKKEVLKKPNLSLQKTILSNKYPVPQDLITKLEESEKGVHLGGELQAKMVLDDFLQKKIEKYWESISYPEKSRYYSSMISAYITYGNISIKQIYQRCEEFQSIVKNKKSLNQFKARLKWHCHFIQKLEMEPSIEFENLNPLFNQIRKNKNKKFIKAWTQGQTGYPLVDAAMRCVEETGFLNFRLRAMVVSFFTHLLWQPWTAGSGHLARMFIDYEPGIHFSQFQMQAGTTGINTIRIYNPIKQSKEKDKDGAFIKRWVPELRDLPTKYIHEPWEMTDLDSLLYNFKLGKNYPRPIVEFSKAYKLAKDKLWKLKKSNANQYISKAIVKKHTRMQKKL